MSGETSGPHEGLEGERKEARDDVLVQDSNLGHVEHTVREEAHDSEKPSRSPQPPTQPPMQGEERASVKNPPVAKRKPRGIRSPQPPTQPPTQEERASVKSPPVAKRTSWGIRKPRVSREENERRLEGQRLLFERKCEERRKAEEAAAAAAHTQTEREECSTNGGEHPNQQRSGSEDEEAQRDQQRKPSVAVKVDEDQKVDSNDAKIVDAPEFQALERDTGATCLTITEEHCKSHLIRVAHPTSALPFAPPSMPITPRFSSDSTFSHPGVGYCYYGNDATSQCECQYQYGLVREDCQTGIDSNYLFDPPLLRWPSPKPEESVQTCQDATEVLFQPSGDSAGTAVITVIIPAKTEYCARNDYVSTKSTTHEFQRGRHISGRGGHRGFHRGFRSRGRGGRGPRDGMS